MNELLNATRRLWLEVLESAQKLEPGTQEATAHVSMLEALNRGSQMVQHLDQGIKAVGYATLRYGFVAAKRDDEAQAMVALVPGALMALLELEAELKRIENGPELNMRKSARGARLNTYTALATGDPQVIASHIAKLRNTCVRYDPDWGGVLRCTEAMLAAFTEEG